MAELRARAQILQSLGEIVLAKSDLSHILAAHPEEPDDWLRRAELAVIQKDWTLAAADFEQAMQRGSRKSSAAIGWVLTPLIAGKTAVHRGRCPDILEAAIHSSSNVRTNFACCLLAEPETFKSIDPKPLVDALRGGLSTAPSDGTEVVIHAIGQRTGDPTAIEHLTRLTDSAADPGDREFARTFLIKAHVAAGNKEQARLLLAASSQTGELLGRQSWWWAWLLKHLRDEAVAELNL